MSYTLKFFIGCSIYVCSYVLLRHFPVRHVPVGHFPVLQIPVTQIPLYYRPATYRIGRTCRRSVSCVRRSERVELNRRRPDTVRRPATDQLRALCCLPSAGCSDDLHTNIQPIRQNMQYKIAFSSKANHRQMCVFPVM